MTDNILYLDEQGSPCDDYRDIHEAIDETTKMLLSMTKEERIEWFRESRYPYPINFDMEIGNTVYSVSSHFKSSTRITQLAKSATSNLPQCRCPLKMSRAS
ncbi:hypothetical protein H8S44_14525 [Anaerosacchariphilus sp. NSJ-68]|uniref:Uncharacterized protein n=2 Tax=Lachnospiraceae TaxID=186803 RepID=A0A923LE29_9FIRM|nr:MULTISPECIES: hypothetical protein [Lachnospiraceae]MBC5660975.1 hypothetical protein [Anaerosacchariphilus hominis]MBC5699632.1 hypothetical protein [Roseburia difficilis]